MDEHIRKDEDMYRQKNGHFVTSVGCESRIRSAVALRDEMLAALRRIIDPFVRGC